MRVPAVEAARRMVAAAVGVVAHRMAVVVGVEGADLRIIEILNR